MLVGLVVGCVALCRVVVTIEMMSEGMGWAWMILEGGEGGGCFGFGVLMSRF